MNNTMFRMLIAKDLHLQRMIIIATLLAGIAAAVLVSFEGRWFYLGSITTLCALIILPILLVQSGVLAERREKVHLFVLSMPISGYGYQVAKVAGLAIAFFTPFLIITGMILGAIAFNAGQRAYLPFALTVLMYFPLAFAFLLSIALASRSEGPNNIAIIIVTVAINPLVEGLLRIPPVAASIEGSTIVWPEALLLVSSLEAGLAVLIPALTLGFLRQRKDSI